MALSERTFIREVLIVRADGPGGTWAAHQVPITEILKDGKVVAAQYGNAEPLDAHKIGNVLDPAFIEIVAERDALKKALADCQAERASDDR